MWLDYRDAAAQQSIGVRRAADALAFERQLLVRQIRDLERLVTDLDQEIGRRYSSVDRYLRTIPGVGAATAPAIYAEIGAIRRFTDSDQLVALVGVDPQLHESGQTADQAKMSKRGQAAHRIVPPGAGVRRLALLSDAGGPWRSTSGRRFSSGPGAAW